MQRLEASLEKKLADLNEAWRQLEFRHQVLPEERRRAKSEECCRRESEIAAEMLEVLRRQRVLEKEMEEWTQWGLQQKMKYQELRRLLSEKTMEAEKGLEWELHRRGVEIWGAKFGTIMSPFKHLEFIPPSFDWREGLIDPALGSDDSVSP